MKKGKEKDREKDHVRGYKQSAWLVKLEGIKMYLMVRV